MSRSLKRLVLIVMDSLMIVLASIASAFFLKVITKISSEYLHLSTIAVVLLYILIALRLRVFSIVTRFTDSRSLIKIGISILISNSLLFAYSAFFVRSFSYRYIFLLAVFSFINLITPRLIWRFVSEWKKKEKSQSKPKTPTLVIGAGYGGHLFISTVIEKNTDIKVVGIVDDRNDTKGTYVYGIKVLGNTYDIPRLVEDLEIKQVVIAAPSITVADKERIIDICQKTGVKVNSMPSVENTILGNVGLSSLKEIDIADLLGRDEVILDQTQLDIYFSDKTVLVTGAGGSIGSELCRQIMSFSPKRLLLLGHGENSIYLIHRELLEKYGSKANVIPIIADIQDRELMFEIMANYKPDIVYHAAAHKHVPLMEYNPHEAVKNNIFGTKNVAEAAKSVNVSKFVMVSTDKAVNPPNVMGATKRIAEMIVTGLNETNSTQFVAVRFGNVLGSRGSVVPLFKEQIKKGGPVTVTDFRMTRYFMTIPEASRLVIQAGYLAKGGEIFVLDMGEPVQILELAKKIIKLSGYTETEIPIVESGIRPGEKLYEELLSSSERVSEQVHDKIFVGKVKNKDAEIVNRYLLQLEDISVEELKNSLIDFAKQEK